ncbi:MAG TPA: heme ABC transporter ATP-binding protein [Dehalococcoidia bacterium]|nr:heme ABC transporter ATP-binding protein [Dehalococcoidia bacterium]
MSRPGLQATSLSFQVGSVRLVREVSLEARTGEVLTVVGPNGAGKSTLLRLLSGELTPTSGEVILDGRDLQDYPARDLALKRAVLPQQTVLQFAFSARDVVLMGRNPHLRDGWPSREDREITERQMERTETTAFATRTFPSLSGGEQSRVTLARVLAQEAPILLLDEPTSSLDVKHQEMVMQVARELAVAGACVLVIIHDLNLAAAYSDRIALLQGGSLMACGAPDEVLREDLLSSVFECELTVLEGHGLDHPLVVPRRGWSQGAVEPTREVSFTRP